MDGSGPDSSAQQVFPTIVGMLIPSLDVTDNEFCVRSIVRGGANDVFREIDEDEAPWPIEETTKELWFDFKGPTFSLPFDRSLVPFYLSHPNGKAHGPQHYNLS